MAGSARASALQTLASVGLFCLPALVIAVPSNLLPFGLILLASSLIGADYLWRTLPAAGKPLWGLAALTALALAVTALSIWQFDFGLRDFDNRSRFVVMPWVMLWLCALRPAPLAWWWGAVVGLMVVAGLSFQQVLAGAERADLWTNAIVLADMSLMLMVVAVFCRPAQAARWVVLALVAGIAVIVLSGSRGVWLPLALLLITMVMTLRWGRLRTRWLSLLAAASLAIGAVALVPGVSDQLRLTELQQDMQRLDRGDVNSSAGARWERLQVAWETFQEHPWQGVGIGHFDDAMRRLPACQLTQGAPQRCFLSHAHNDLAEWAATQGIPGILLLLAVYGGPLAMFVWLYRRSGRQEFRGPAAAGVMLVAAYVLCGMTQSMFAHQITASFYVCAIGVLVGQGWMEVRAQRRGGSTNG